MDGVEIAKVEALKVDWSIPRRRPDWSNSPQFLDKFKLTREIDREFLLNVARTSLATKLNTNLTANSTPTSSTPSSPSTRHPRSRTYI